MLISETMVGGLIGRCGSNISRIRNESGAMIKVSILVTSSGRTAMGQVCEHQLDSLCPVEDYFHFLGSCSGATKFNISIESEICFTKGVDVFVFETNLGHKVVKHRHTSIDVGPVFVFCIFGEKQGCWILH